MPHKRLRLGGSSGSSSTDGCVGRAGMPDALPGLDTSGEGHVIYPYHDWDKRDGYRHRGTTVSADRPLGGTVEGNSFGSGDQRG